MPLWLGLWAYLMGINAVAFGAMALDKRLAIARERRISENNLLFLGMIGGTPGLYLARWYCRHKTRKAAFYLPLHILAFIQMLALAWFFLSPAT